MGEGSACGKVILFGEHAVVYGKPGIAVPVNNVSFVVRLSDSKEFSYETNVNLDEIQENKLKRLFLFLQDRLGLKKDINIRIESNLPVAGGLGSSASVSVALIRAIADHHNMSLSSSQINEIAFECEKIFHGSPSGIDNTVISYNCPIFYQEKNFEFIKPKENFKLVIASTGIQSDTGEVVTDVRTRYNKEPERYEKILNNIEDVTIRARNAIINGNIKELGSLMTVNHELLKELGVSCPELDKLVNIALSSGALGAKMAGAGMGGNIVAITDESNQKRTAAKLSRHSPWVIIAQIK
jgi:mevalonate kinase